MGNAADHAPEWQTQGGCHDGRFRQERDAKPGRVLSYLFVAHIPQKVADTWQKICHRRKLLVATHNLNATNSQLRLVECFHLRLDDEA